MNDNITKGQQQDNNDSQIGPHPLQGNSAITQTTNQNTASPANSVVSRHSVRSQSHNIQLRLQRLEEEREFNRVQAQLHREYLNKKYQLLEEAEDLCDISSNKSQSVQKWVKELPFQNQTTKTSVNNTLSAATNVANGSTLNQAAYLSELPTNITTNPVEQNPNLTNIICSSSGEVPQILNVCSYPIVTNTASNRTVAPNCATTTVTCYNNQKRAQSLLTQSVLEQPATVTFSQFPVAENNNAAQPKNFELNKTYPDSSVPQQPLYFDTPIFTNSPISSTQYFNTAPLPESSIHARQSVPKELPIFSGDSEDWPLFISTFEWSSAMCRFTHAENLIRLQKSIKGEALQSVQHMLVHPLNVPKVIEILRMLYGQPEKILNSIKNKINLTPKVDENNLQTLTSFAIKVRSLIATINAASLPDEINNSFLLHQLLQKLPSSYRMQWATIKLQLTKENKKANLSEFDNWLFNIGLTASSISIDSTTNMQKSFNNSKSNVYNNRSPINAKAGIYSHNERKCIVCSSSDCKTVSDCQKYKSLDRGEKWKVVRTKKLCKYCLCLHNNECKKKKRCGEENCEYFHHPSLHRFSMSTNNVSKEISNKQNPQTVMKKEEVNNSHSVKFSEVLFKIIPIKIHGNHKTINTFAFIDDGSSISLLDEAIAQELKIEGEHSPLCLKWTGGMQRNEQNSKKLIIEISGENKQRVSLNVNTVKALSLPTQSLDYQSLRLRYNHLQNLPIKSYTNAVPRLLIGLNHFNIGISNKIREGALHEPVAVRTKLGWLIYGTTAESQNASKHFNFHTCSCSNYEEKLEELVKSFYTLESVGITTKDPLVSENEKRALSLLNKFTKLKKNGHYEVPLLWKYDSFTLPDSFQMALKRLVCLERKLLQNVDLYETFKNTISKYIERGYVRKLSEAETQRDDGKVWYLPIFVVFNRNKPGKSRVVWDAAAKSEGISLNSFLLKGPDMLASLPSILLKFRENSIALCGDIEEMFLQIHIRQEDRDVQRFLWRDCDQSKSPDVYVMDVMIFGATCAPAISQYIKNMNADKFRNKYPLASKCIKENHYVDDLLVSVNTPEEAIKLLSDVSYVHQQAGFNIRNWISNSTTVRQAFSTTGSNSLKCISFKEEADVEKVLGVYWEYKEDVFTYKIARWLLESDLFTFKKLPTKRGMLKLVMSIYDPLGLIAHIIMYVKILMQQVWRSKIGWDETIPSELLTKWTQWVQYLPEIHNIKIPRCYLQSLRSYEGANLQLHTFVDASKDGYAAVSYFRLEKDNNIICSLIGAKTKVAPMKITSIPRLELMAALIGARFAKFLVENHDLKISKKYFWCDSKTVLSWIRSDHRKYHQFVAFRITEILELSSISEWNWVPSKQNVADEATKWLKSSKIVNSSRWFKGPDFILQPEEQWPKSETNFESTEEERVQHIHHMAKHEPVFDMLRFSKWKRLKRTAAYVYRFIENCHSDEKQKGELTQEELNNAEYLLYRQAQLEEYSAELSALKLNIPIPKSSDIYFKTPYLENGILRVYGRIDMADVSLEQKRPVILPRKCYITKLICLHYHEKYHHMNNETVINELRQKYSISRLRATYKSIIRSCQMCKINKAVPQVPQMARLPRARLASYTAPFTYTGLDFFGPMLVTANRHKEKRYGCLFTCMTIRAVHLEVAHSLTTSSCILAIRNFMGRRGIPLEFYSDNGTNLVGAERELREALLHVNQNELVKEFTTTNTKWIFNPPASPHMGGAWERLVRSVKTILYKIMPSRHPSDELLLSMLIEVENIINSRPLAYIPIEDDTKEALTPNHFLLGSSSGLKPLTTCDDSGIVLKQNWLISQQFANMFWKRWLTEYLPTLTCRSKWFEKSKPLTQGDLVVIVDPSLPRNVWLRGRVLETRLATDGQARSAKVLTQRGILERPVSKLAILEVASEGKSGCEEASYHTAGGMLKLLPKSS